MKKDPESLCFLGSTSLPVEPLRTPAEFFQYYINDEILEKNSVSDFSLFCTAKPVLVTAHDIKLFIGMCLYMSLVRITSTRSFWSQIW